MRLLKLVHACRIFRGVSFQNVRDFSRVVEKRAQISSNSGAPFLPSENLSQSARAELKVIRSKKKVLVLLGFVKNKFDKDEISTSRAEIRENRTNFGVS